MDLKLRDEEARRQRGLSGKSHIIDGGRRTRSRDRVIWAVPAPEANAENQANLDRWRVMVGNNTKCKSDKFPPPHQDAAVGHVAALENGPVSLSTADNSFLSFSSKLSLSLKHTAAAIGPSRRKNKREGAQMASSHTFVNSFLPSSVQLSMDRTLKRRS